MPQGVSIYKENYSKYPLLFIFFALFVNIKDDNNLFYLITYIRYYARSYKSLGE